MKCLYSTSEALHTALHKYKYNTIIKYSTNTEKQRDDINVAVGNSFVQRRALSGASVHITTSTQQQTATSTTITLTTTKNIDWQLIGIYQLENPGK